MTSKTKFIFSAREGKFRHSVKIICPICNKKMRFHHRIEKPGRAIREVEENQA